MKKALIIVPELGNNYESLTPTLEGIAKELSRKYFTHSVRISSETLLNLILEVGSDKENIILYGYFGFDICLNGLNIGTPRLIADVVVAKQFTIVDDPLFASWMFKRIKGASKNIMFLCTSQKVMEQIEEIRQTKTQTIKIDLPANAPMRELSDLKHYNERSYDLVIPCSATPVNSEELIESGSRTLGTLASLYFNHVKNSVNLLNYFRLDSFALSKDFFFTYAPSLKSQVEHPLEYEPILQFVWQVDAWVRHTFRIEIIKHYARIENIKTLLLSDSGLKIDAHDKFEIRGPAYGEEYLTLLKNTKYVLDIAIPGCDEVHVRAKAAYAAGAAVISNNPNMNSLLDSSTILDATSERLLNQEYWDSLRSIGHRYVKSLTYELLAEQIAVQSIKCKRSANTP